MIKLQILEDVCIGYATITKCSDFMFWYSRSVGSVYPVYRESLDVYWVRDNDGFRNTLLKQDVILTKKEKTNE